MTHFTRRILIVVGHIRALHELCELQYKLHMGTV